jgi:glycine reductase complex component B subunit gamma
MLRVVHYINQFFAGLGGEEAGGISPRVLDKPTGPTILLQQLLAESGEVAATVSCGDNYAVEHDEALEEILGLIRSYEPTLVIAGPAFNAGRYGITCARVVAALAREGVPAVTGLHIENPGVDVERQFVFAVPVAGSAVGMRDAMQRMVTLGSKLVAGAEIGSPTEDDYIERGVRRNVMSDRTAAERAVDLLVKKLRGEPFTSEIPLPSYDRVTPTPLETPLDQATIAIVTEAGLVPAGNPDRLESARATHWFTYPIEGLETFAAGDYFTIHGGFDNGLINENPNRGVPLDALRAMERDGVFKRLHDQYYVTTGMTMPIAEAERIGQEIAASLRANNIHAALLTST